MSATAARPARPARRETVALAGVAAIAAMAAWAPRPALFFHSAASQITAGGFAAGLAFPVRAVERAEDSVSRNVLVHVRCAGRARFVSACWVSKR